MHVNAKSMKYFLLAAAMLVIIFYSIRAVNKDLKNLSKRLQVARHGKTTPLMINTSSWGSTSTCRSNAPVTSLIIMHKGFLPQRLENPIYVMGEAFCTLFALLSVSQICSEWVCNIQIPVTLHHHLTMQTVILAVILAVAVADYHYDKLRDKCAWRSDLNSYGKSWIEQSRPLPNGRLVSMSVRFCENREIALQLWDEVEGETNAKILIWQKLVTPTEVLGGYTKININQSEIPMNVTSSTRFGCFSPDNGMIPLFSRFLNGMEVATISSEEDGPFTVNNKYEFSELATPIYFDVIVCTENDCSKATQEDHMDEVVDRCEDSSLKRTSGRPLMEMHLSPPSGIVRAIEMVICGVMPFFIQVWRPVQTKKKRVYQLVWQKQITCLPGRSNGRIVQIKLQPEEYFFCQPEYRLALHVEYGDFAVPVPTRFALDPNIAMASPPSQDPLNGFTSGFIQVCQNTSFDDLAVPYEFKLRLCNSEDCSLSPQNTSQKSPNSYDLYSCDPTTTTSTTSTTTMPTTMASTVSTTTLNTTTMASTSTTTATSTMSTAKSTTMAYQKTKTTTQPYKTPVTKKTKVQPPAQAAKQNADSFARPLHQTGSSTYFLLITSVVLRMVV